ncbi:unnamed protein product [Aphanomyces euteiches]
MVSVLHVFLAGLVAVQALDSTVCSTLKTCLAYGKVSCDVTTQFCPPCIYLDAKGQTLCFDKVTGTALCPFVNTTADCSSGTNTTLPPLLNRSATPTTAAPALSTSSWNGLSTGLFVVLMLILVGALGAAGWWYWQRRQQQQQQMAHGHNLEDNRASSSNIFFLKNSEDRFRPQPQGGHAMKSDSMLDTRLSSSTGNNSFCHILESTRESGIRSSDA